MIRTDGGFWLQLDIGSIKDFVERPEDLMEFTVVESCGNSLPEFILAFISDDEKILPLLHEGTPIKATYGKDANSLEAVLCFTGKLVTTKEGENDRSFTINGLCVDQGYITNGNLLTFSAKSGIEVVLEVLAKTFRRIDSNITKSNDSQVWIQPSITDKAFVSKTLMHVDLGTSFPVYAIAADGTFILRDAVKFIRGEKPKWRFTSQRQAPTDIEFLADGAIESNSTFMNNWTGYSKVTKVLKLISNQVADVFTAFKPLLSVSNISEAMPNILYRFKGFKVQSDSVHANYWASADRNLVYQTQMSKIDVTHSFVDQYYPIRVLDLVIIKEYGKDSITSSDYISGLYFVTRVSKTIQGKKLITTVGFNRESMNSIKNVEA